MPVPDSVMLSGVLVALVAMVSLTDLLAAASGLNVTAIVHDSPAAKLAGQLFVCANQVAAVPVTLTLLTEKAAAPLLVSANTVEICPMALPFSFLQMRGAQAAVLYARLFDRRSS
jgi:hypothetical protein